MASIGLRDYEVSLWTIQDSFITVLKSYGANHKGQIQEPDMSIKNDGTLEFSFSIPMYLREKGKKIENPLWYNTRNGNVLVDLRKVKVIFNKKMPLKEKVFEFLITCVKEKHEKGSLVCEVKTEGLAFHELGKIGYKISLSKDAFYDEYNEWYDNGAVKADEPHATLNYWCDKIFGSGENKRTRWEYEICMDWTMHDGSVKTIINNDTFDDYINLSDSDKELVNNYREQLGYRRRDKIYEDEYISAWDIQNSKLVATNIEPDKEKERMIEVSESNIYNLTQTLAETFGVFCKYEYIHDELYYIIGRKIIFYNNFIQESTGSITLAYPYQTSHIEREMDATDLVTKMYVKPISDDILGEISIINTAANKSGEDYLLNFDYLHDINVIDDDKYAQIAVFEANVKKINLELEPLSTKLNRLQIEVNNWKAEKAIADNSITTLETEIAENWDRMLQISNGSETMTRGDSTPMISILLKETNANTGYLRISDLGVLVDGTNTIKIYSELSGGSVTGSYVEISQPSSNLLVTDENGNITRIKGLAYPTDASASKTRYLTYSYKPLVYYQNIAKMYSEQLRISAKKQSDLAAKIVEGEATITSLSNTYSAKLKEKQKLILEFEKLMGPALREGTWQPENYTDYGEQITNEFYITNAYKNNSNYIKDNVSFIWDTEPFDGEQLLYETVGINEEKRYRLCIKIDGLVPSGVYANQLVVDRILDNLNDLAVCYYKTTSEHYGVNEFTPLRLHGESEIIFVKHINSNNIMPVLVLTVQSPIDPNYLTQNYMLKNPDTHPSVSSVKVNYTNQNQEVYEPKSIIYWENSDFNGRWLYTLDGKYVQVFPRIKVGMTNIIDSADQIHIKVGNEILERYTDYSSLVRDECYYYTLSSEKALKLFSLYYHNTNTNNLSFTYTKSHTDVSIYLDALEVLKENSYPKVSYTVDVALTNKDFIETAYNTLNKIVKIVDIDLKFFDVQGYISELQLNLDKPGEDKIVVQNYKTKFEDLFSTIVAQTEEMKKIAPTLTAATAIFSSSGTVQNSLKFDSNSKIVVNSTLSFVNSNNEEIMRLDSFGNLYLKGSIQKK